MSDLASADRVRLRIATAPHSPKQRLIMEAPFIPGLLEMWVACGTKFGKTWALGTALARFAPIQEQALMRWVAPIYTQSKIGYKYCRRMLPRDKEIVRPNDSELTLTFPYADSQIQFFHGQNPESLEGEATALSPLDEAAKLKEDAYRAVKTTTAVTKGPIIGVSTPNGKNWFYHKCMQAKEEMLAAKREGRRPTKIFIHAPTRDNPSVSKEVIEDAKKTLSERAFRQYFEAEFLDDGSVFLYVWEAFGRPGLNDYWSVDTWYASTHESKAIYVGVDWARKNDYTIFYALNDQGRCIGYKRFNKIGWIDQVAAMRAFCDEVRRCSILVNPYLKVLHDETGIGDVIASIIAVADFPYDISGIVWDNTSKNSTVNELMLSLEERCLHLTPWATLRDELSTFEVTLSKTGKTTYAAPNGLYDDTVMALAMANALYREGRNSNMSMILVNNIDDVIARLRFEGGKNIEDLF